VRDAGGYVAGHAVTCLLADDEMKVTLGVRVEVDDAARLAARDAGFELLEPVEDDLDPGVRAPEQLRLSGGDDPEKLAARGDVVEGSQVGCARLERPLQSDTSVPFGILYRRPDPGG
jgi:hypothetical protein